MPPEFAVLSNQAGIIRRHPVVTYFALTFLISWAGALAVAAPHFIRYQPLPQTTGILMFPVMLLGPSLAGIVLTRIVDGKSGLRVLLSQMFRARVPPRWYTALLLPPALVMTVLLFLEADSQKTFPCRITEGLPVIQAQSRIPQSLGFIARSILYNYTNVNLGGVP